MVLQTEKVLLKPTRSEDLPRIMDIEQANARFIGSYQREKHEAILLDGSKVHLSVFDRTDGMLIGYAILAGLGDDNNSIEFRRLAISRKENGFGRDTIRLVKSLCFEKLRVHRLWFDVISDNFRAIKLYESEGFKREGLIRDCVKSGEEYRSIWVMALLEDEYLNPVIKARV
ncbi:MAG: GNAT family protein [Bacteroidales bacterium]